MNLDLWYLIVTTTMEVRLLLDSALPSQRAEGPEAADGATLHPAVRTRLRESIMDKLSELRSKLKTLLSDKEAGMVLLPLAIHIDELIMRRLSSIEQAQWRLLQHELFDLHNGGEVFFDFIEERLNMPDTPQLAFDVLYFCLSDGFTGKYTDSPARIEQWKRQLAERIPVPAVPQGAPKKRRAKEDAEQSPVVPPPNAAWFYLSALVGVVLLIALTGLFTNL